MGQFKTYAWINLPPQVCSSQFFSFLLPALRWSRRICLPFSWAPLIFFQVANEDWALHKWIDTEGELHVEHKVEEDPEGPHVNFKAIHSDLSSCKYFRGHKLFSSEDSASYIGFLLAESEVCQFIALNRARLTYLPFSFLMRTFWDLISRCRYP